MKKYQFYDYEGQNFIIRLSKIVTARAPGTFQISFGPPAAIRPRLNIPGLPAAPPLAPREFAPFLRNAIADYFPSREDCWQLLNLFGRAGPEYDFLPRRFFFALRAKKCLLINSSKNGCEAGSSKTATLLA